MTLRATLQEVVNMVRAEARLSTNTSRGIDHLEHIQQLIKRHYYMLAEDYDWRHLEIKRDTGTSRKVLQANSRYYDFPTALNPLRITDAWVKFGGTWQKLDFGITYEDRSSFDPDIPQTTDPVQKWDFYGGTQFEVWPMPASNGTANDDGEIAFEGQKNVERLTGNSSRLDMDDMLVSLFVATEILAENEKELAAKLKGEAAMTRLGRLRANTGSKTRYRMGLGRVDDGARRPQHPTHIRSA